MHDLGCSVGEVGVSPAVRVVHKGISAPVLGPCNQDSAGHVCWAGLPVACEQSHQHRNPSPSANGQTQAGRQASAARGARPLPDAPGAAAGHGAEGAGERQQRQQPRWRAAGVARRQPPRARPRRPSFPGGPVQLEAPSCSGTTAGSGQAKRNLLSMSTSGCSPHGRRHSSDQQAHTFANTGRSTSQEGRRRPMGAWY
jgi:hypothetical protein